MAGEMRPPESAYQRSGRPHSYFFSMHDYFFFMFPLGRAGL